MASGENCGAVGGRARATFVAGQGRARGSKAWGVKEEQEQERVLYVRRCSVYLSAYPIIVPRRKPSPLSIIST